MCGRYNIITDPQALIDGFSVAILPFDINCFEVIEECFPGQNLPVIRQTEAGRELTLMRWGLIPHWSKTEKQKYSTINARSETILDKPTYRNSFLHKRCIIPATGFFEWSGSKGNKRKYYISDGNNSLMAFAGLWDCWKSEDKIIESFTIITTNANEEVGLIPQRMPVILGGDEVDQWLRLDGVTPQENMAILKPFHKHGLDIVAL